MPGKRKEEEGIGSLEYCNFKYSGSGQVSLGRYYLNKISVTDHG